MVSLMSGAAVAGGTLGGIVVWRRLRDWEPSGDRVGEVLARGGIEATDRMADLAAKTGELANDAVTGTMRFAGTLTAKSMGASVNTMADITTKVVPGLGHDEDEPAEEVAVKPAAKKPAAKKATAKKQAARKKTASVSR